MYLYQATGKYLTDLTDKLQEFVREVDSLEDWQLPVINTIEARTFMQGNLGDVANKLKVIICSFFLIWQLAQSALQCAFIFCTCMTGIGFEPILHVIHVVPIFHSLGSILASCL